MQPILLVFFFCCCCFFCREGLREKKTQILFTSRLICALIWYVQSVYSNCDTEFEYLYSSCLTTVANKHTNASCHIVAVSLFRSLTLSLSVTHTHTHNLKCPLCIPNTDKRLALLPKTKSVWSEFSTQTSRYQEFDLIKNQQHVML